MELRIAFLSLTDLITTTHPSAITRSLESHLQGAAKTHAFQHPICHMYTNIPT
jgi:hypothetical protein